MKTNLIPLLFIVFIASCTPTISKNYMSEFDQSRDKHLSELIEGEHAPLKKEDLGRLSHYAYSVDYRVIASFHPSEKRRTLEMATYSGKIKEFIDLGTLRFRLNEKELELHVYQNVKFITHPLYSDYYFIPFKDETTGDSSYGGGRYLDMNKADFSSSKIVLDFNAAYNPWCVYADGYNCPIPPQENFIAVKIHAGEKNYDKAKSH